MMGGRAITDEEIVTLASLGDAEAQSTLVDMALALPAEGTCGRFEAACLAEIPARLAAAHGGVDERLKLAGLLLARAETLDEIAPDRARTFKAEAAGVLSGLTAEGSRAAAVALASLLDGMADEGDEFAGQALAELSLDLPSDVMCEAAGFSLLLRGEMAGTA